MFYAVTIGLPVLYTGITKKIKTKNLDRLFIILFSILISFRSGTGVDLDNYRHYYYLFTQGMTLKQEYYPAGGFEPGYVVLNYILAKLGMPFGILLFFISVFHLMALYTFMEEYHPENKLFAVFLYFSIFDIYMNSLQIIRQSIALGFYFLAVTMVKREKYIRACFLVLFGTLFHWTALMILPFMIFFSVSRKIKVKYLMLLAAAVPVLWYLLFHTGLPGFITGIAGNQSSIRLNLYINYYNLDSDRWTNLTAVFVWMLVVILWIVFLAVFQGVSSDGILKLKKGSFFQKKIELDIADWSVIGFLLTKECLYAYYLAMLTRFQFYFFAFVPFVISRAVMKCKGTVKTSVILVLSVVFIWRFIKTCYEMSTDWGIAIFSLVNYI